MDLGIQQKMEIMGEAVSRPSAAQLEEKVVYEKLLGGYQIVRYIVERLGEQTHLGVGERI